MSETAWSFSTRDLPPDERTPAWTDAMRRLRMPLVTPRGAGPVDGKVVVAISPMGLQFARVEADAQDIAGRSDDQIEGMWLSLLLEGKGRLSAPDLEASIEPGMILCGITRQPIALALTERHRQLFVRLPQVAIAPRLLAGLGLPVMLIDARAGMAAIFGGLLCATATELERLGPDQLRPVELAVIEFLVASIAEAGGTRARGGADGARAALLHRILQRMETMLGDPDLSIDTLARDQGISTRYLRRLFAAEDLNFTAVVKARRLDRCYADLMSPLHAQLGISEIAFRWGFNDAAHFSRSFRDRFGTSARDHRRQALPA
ncbi:helix-turn-helix domain-containing protein [Sphingomonas sp. MMS24-J13]|uniref:helix-turn-helix domain-containing protein n=1 Tax=Sphingomonas sp. MMS24-J13 TaxID=3238686 RepID=UPI00384F2D03